MSWARCSAIVGIVLLNAGLISGLLAVAVIVGLYAVGYFLASRPQITQDIGALPAKDSDKIEAGLDQMLATIRRRVAPDIYQRRAEHPRRDRLHA